MNWTGNWPVWPNQLEYSWPITDLLRHLGSSQWIKSLRQECIFILKLFKKRFPQAQDWKHMRTIFILTQDIKLMLRIFHHLIVFEASSLHSLSVERQHTATVWLIWNLILAASHLSVRQTMQEMEKSKWSSLAWRFDDFSFPCKFTTCNVVLQFLSHSCRDVHLARVLLLKTCYFCNIWWKEYWQCVPWPCCHGRQGWCPSPTGWRTQCSSARGAAPPSASHQPLPTHHWKIWVVREQTQEL